MCVCEIAKSATECLQRGEFKALYPAEAAAVETNKNLNFKPVLKLPSKNPLAAFLNIKTCTQKLFKNVVSTISVLRQYERMVRSVLLGQLDQLAVYLAVLFSL